VLNGLRNTVRRQLVAPNGERRRTLAQAEKLAPRERKVAPHEFFVAGRKRGDAQIRDATREVIVDVRDTRTTRSSQRACSSAVSLASNRCTGPHALNHALPSPSGTRATVAHARSRTTSIGPVAST